MAESIALGLRLGTTAEHANFAGIEGEITINETEKRAVVHDGTTKGGFPMARLDETGYALAKSSDGTKLQLKNKAGTVLSETDAPAGGGGSGVYVGNDAPTDASTDVWIDLDEPASGVVTSVNGKSGDVTVTSVSGNAGTATKLATSRTITLGGDVSGSASFDGSKDITLNVTVNGGVGGGDYTLPAATSSTLGGVTIGSNITVSNGKISLSSSNVTSALGFTPLSTTGTAAKATADASGNTITSTYAKLASPNFTGTPKAPTATAGTNTTQIATTAFVQTAVSSAGGGIPKSGNRGSLAGYETIGNSTVFGSAYEPGDTNQTTSSITVYDGNSGTSWTKIVRLTSSSPSVSFVGSKWTWKDGTAPTLSTGGILVLCWCGDGGIANFIAP